MNSPHPFPYRSFYQPLSFPQPKQLAELDIPPGLIPNQPMVAGAHWQGWETGPQERTVLWVGMALPVFLWWQIKTIKDTGVVIHTKKGDGFAYLEGFYFLMILAGMFFFVCDGSILCWIYLWLLIRYLAPFERYHFRRWWNAMGCGCVPGAFPLRLADERKVYHQKRDGRTWLQSDLFPSPEVVKSLLLFVKTRSLQINFPTFACLRNSLPFFVILSFCRFGTFCQFFRMINSQEPSKNDLRMSIHDSRNPGSLRRFWCSSSLPTNEAFAQTQSKSGVFTEFDF